MKKNRTGTWFPLKKSRAKILMMMKLTFLLMCGFVLSLSAAVRAQDQMVTLKVEGMPFTKVISELKRQTQLDFFYSFNEVDVNQAISLDVKNTKIDEVLRQMLGKRFSWEYVDKMVIIKPTVVNELEKKSLRVKGFVYDTQKMPLPGVTVKVVGLPVGTSTNEKGWFALDLPLLKGALEFSFVGFKKRQVDFTEKTDTLRIVLEEDVSDLDEVVVRAYGSQKKREVVSAISTVTADEMKELPAASITSMLQARLAGVNVIMQSGAPGSAPVVAVRGFNSLLVDGASDGQPLWVVDGVPMHSFVSPVTGTNTLADLDPSMIESVQVLKDAAAASIYGSRAGNGVILITTKKGRAGETMFAANVSYSASQVVEWPLQTGGRMERWLDVNHMRNYKDTYYHNGVYVYPISYEQVWQTYGTYDKFWKNGDRSVKVNFSLQDSLDPYYNSVQNWYKYMMGTGKVLNANIQASGGSDKFQYMVGAGYYDEDGIIINSAYKRASVRSNLSAKLTNKLRLDTRIYLSYIDRTMNKSRNRNSNSNYEGMEVTPSQQPTYMAADKKLQDEWLKNIRQIKDRTDDYRIMGSMFLEYELWKELSFSASGNIDYSQSNMNKFTPSVLDSWYHENVSSGAINRVLSYSTEELLHYMRSFGEKHNIDVLLGFNGNKEQNFYIGGEGRGGSSDKVSYYDSQANPPTGEHGSSIVSMTTYDSDFTEKAMVSYFGRLGYNYMQRYLVEFSFRRDGSSTFGVGHRWANFPSVALGWTFSEEPFIKQFTGKWLNWGKIRGSYGTSGQIFDKAYLAYGLMKQVKYYTFQGNSLVGSAKPISPDLTWEKTKQYDLGIDLDMFDYRANLKLDYYYKYTSALIYDVTLPGGIYPFSSRVENAMEVSNEGLEMELLVDILRESPLNWRTKLNVSKNWNRFEKSYSGKDISNFVIGNPLYNMRLHDDHGFYDSEDEVPRFYTYDGFETYMGNRSTELGVSGWVGSYKLSDLDGDGRSVGDLFSVGSPLPLAHGGWVNELRWKNFDLNILVNFSLGRKIINKRLQSLNESGPKFLDYRKLKYWTEPGCDANLPRVGEWVRTDLASMVEKVNYMSLKQLTLGYNLPVRFARKTGFSGVRFFATGENLFYWNNYSGENSEVVDVYTGQDSGTAYPLPRKWTLGLTLNF